MAVADISAEFGAEELLTKTEISQNRLILRRFMRHKLAVFGTFVLIFLFGMAFIGPLLSPYDPNDLVSPANLAPNAQHLFGTDELGRDVLTRLMWAGRISLLLAIVVTVASTAFGVTLGAVAGYHGGWMDSALMRFVDFLLTLPLLPMLLILAAIKQRGGLPISTPGPINQAFGWVWSMSPEDAEGTLILAIILIVFSWMGVARLVRGQVLALKTLEFTDASRALGVSDMTIIRKHMVPNSLAPIIVSATLAFGSVIIFESALSFLGFGVQPPAASWGNMLNGVREFMLIQPWRAFIPGLTIFLASLSFNFIGDALRDALDPRLKL
jgi:peptide/nickel transport system permease protein